MKRKAFDAELCRLNAPVSKDVFSHWATNTRGWEILHDEEAFSKWDVVIRKQDGSIIPIELETREDDAIRKIRNHVLRMTGRMREVIGHEEWGTIHILGRKIEKSESELFVAFNVSYTTMFVLKMDYARKFPLIVMNTSMKDDEELADVPIFEEEDGVMVQRVKMIDVPESSHPVRLGWRRVMMGWERAEYEVVNGDILDSEAQCIAHQCNCLTRTSSGVARQIFSRFPNSDIYSGREAPNEPGHIVIKRDGGKIIINMLSQFEPGGPGGEMDSEDDRRRYFESCLDEIPMIEGLSSVAFPFRIGCGLAGGDWEGVYEPMLNDFAKRMKARGIRTLVHVLSSEGNL